MKSLKVRKSVVVTDLESGLRGKFWRDKSDGSLERHLSKKLEQDCDLLYRGHDEFWRGFSISHIQEGYVVNDRLT